MKNRPEYFSSKPEKVWSLTDPDKDRIRLLEKQLRAANARFYKMKEINGNALGWMNTRHYAEATEALKEGQKV